MLLLKRKKKKKRMQCGIKLYKIVAKTGYTSDMQAYLGKNNENCPALYDEVNMMTECVKGNGHKLYMDIFFFFT